MPKKIIDTKIIKELADLLNKKGLSEIKVQQGDTKIKLAKGNIVTTVAPQVVATSATQTSAKETKKERQETASVATADVDTSGGSGGDGKAITAPMVGTAYHAPEPGAKPFVTEGQQIKTGDTIMIIEAMKTMNQIHADKNGTVIEVCVEDGQPVEFGEPLIIIK